MSEATPQETKRQPEHRQLGQTPAEDGGAEWTTVFYRVIEYDTVIEYIKFEVPKTSQQ